MTTSLGVDIGGSGIKGAPVDLDTGQLTEPRLRMPTPQPATPAAVAERVRKVIDHFGWDGPFGCTFPAVIVDGVAQSAANVDPSWIGTSVRETVGGATGLPVAALNDADAAGVAEAHFGAAQGIRGLVALVTLGTGIGTALLLDGTLIPNSELGHIEIRGADAELTTSAAARDRDGLSFAKWARRLQRYFRALEDLIWPDLFVVGGGISRQADRFLPLLELRTPIVPAALRNEAGIIGAAWYGAEAARRS